MRTGGNNKSGAIFCGQCGTLITEAPQRFKKYSHPQQGRCPFRGLVMPLAAWFTLGKVFSKAGAVERKKQKLRKVGIELEALRARIIAYEQFIGKINECDSFYWWLLTPVNIRKHIGAAFGVLRADEYILECKFIIKTRKLKTSEAIMKATKKRCKFA